MAILHGIPEWEDLDIFFDEFAIDAVLYLVSHDDVYQLRGIFETPYAKRDFGAFVIDAEAPSFTCKYQAEFDATRKGDIIFPDQVSDDINEAYRLQASHVDTWYIDSTPQNDGTGVSTFILTHATTQDDVGDILEDATEEVPDEGGLFG